MNTTLIQPQLLTLFICPLNRLIKLGIKWMVWFWGDMLRISVATLMRLSLEPSREIHCSTKQQAVNVGFPTLTSSINIIIPWHNSMPNNV